MWCPIKNLRCWQYLKVNFWLFLEKNGKMKIPILAKSAVSSKRRKRRVSVQKTFGSCFIVSVANGLYNSHRISRSFEFLDFVRIYVYNPISSILWKLPKPAKSYTQQRRVNMNKKWLGNSDSQPALLPLFLICICSLKKTKKKKQRRKLLGFRSIHWGIFMARLHIDVEGITSFFFFFSEIFQFDFV